MSKQQIIMEMLEMKKNMPFGVDEEEYIITQFSFNHAFDDDFDEMLEVLKEVVIEMKNPEFLQEQERQIAEIASTVTQNNLSQEQLMEYFINELGSRTNSLSDVIENVNDEMRRVFIQRVISSLEEYRIRFDEYELMAIFKGETTKRTDALMQSFSNDMGISITGELNSTANNVSSATQDNLSNRALEKKFYGYEEDLYNEIVFHLQQANHADRFTFSENYYEMLRDLRTRTRQYEEMYLDALSMGIKPLSQSIDQLLDEVVSKSNEMNYNNEELVQSANAMLFK